MVRFNFMSFSTSGIRYEVGMKNKSVIEPSRMVFSLNGKDLTSEVTVGEAEDLSHQRDVSLPRGAFDGGE